MNKAKDETGKQYGLWLVIERAPTPSNKLNKAWWYCKCMSCGLENHMVAGNELRSGRSTKCRKCSNKKHGKAGSREYNSYHAMLNRCYRASNPHYENYGGRGIRVCKNWRKDFERFLEDMGPRPEDHELDRIDNDGDYCPENCRWVTRQENCNNRSSNTQAEYQGKCKTIAEWAREFNVKYGLLYHRVCKRGMTIEEALANLKLK